MLKIFSILRRARDGLFHQSGVLRMNAPENELNGRFDGPVVLEDAKGFLRPEDFAARNTPAEAAGAAQRLRFSQIGLAPLQFGGPFRHPYLEFVVGPTNSR